MEEKKISEQESLELISRMIRNTQRKMEQGAGTPMLIWGGSTIVTTLIVWITVRQTLNYNWNFLWFLIPVIGSLGTVLMQKRPKGVRTYIDKMVGYTWLVLGVTGFVISCLSMLSAMWPFPILFFILVIMGMGTVLTGLITEFRPFVAGGIAGMVLGVGHYFSTGYDLKMLTFAIAFVVMMIIPGFILNYRAKRDV